jgi:hypothetical protein
MHRLKILLKELTSMSLISALLLVTGFAYFEPNILSSQSAESTFEISQTVTAEITFLVAPSDITMSPSLAGVTGGTSDGNTQFRIMTNNNTGFSVTITASSSSGMIGETQGGTIPALIPSVAGVPDYSFSAPTNSAAFGYSISASTTGEITQPFRDNGTDTCGTGATEGTDTCWLDATTTAYTIINRSTETAASGATSTIQFRVQIAADPAPAIPEDTYTATTTLTATMN